MVRKVRFSNPPAVLCPAPVRRSIPKIKPSAGSPKCERPRLHREAGGNKGKEEVGDEQLVGVMTEVAREQLHILISQRLMG